MYWGINSSSCSGDFAGSFSVSPSTFKSILFDIASNFQRWGFKAVVCINCHGDPVHRQKLEESVNFIRDSIKYNIVNAESLPSGTREYVQVKFAASPDNHAGANETAQMWSFLPKLVNHKKAKLLSSQFTFKPLGYVGDPSQFDKYDGNAMSNLFTDDYTQRIIDYIKEEK